MSRTKFVAAVFLFANTTVQASQCTHVGECLSDEERRNGVSLIQTKLQTNVIEEPISIFQGDSRFPFPVVEGKTACLEAATLGRPMVMVYCASGVGSYGNPHFWESEYLQDLFRDISPVFCVIAALQKSSRADLAAVLQKKAEVGGRTALVFGGRTEVASVVSDLEAAGVGAKPHLVVHLSDEGLGGIGGQADEVGQNYKQMLATGAGHVLRQYNFPGAQYPAELKVSPIPLGYSMQMHIGADSCTTARQKAKTSARPFKWSFVGHMKSDRQVMLNEMSKTLGPGNVTVHGDEHNGQSMFEVYQKTELAPIGRGNSNLDCSRIYEAIISGAVPIMVGSHSELQSTFSDRMSGNGIVFADTWQQAASKTKELLANPQKLQANREQNAEWYCRWLGDAKAVVVEAFEVQG